MLYTDKSGGADGTPYHMLVGLFPKSNLRGVMPGDSIPLALSSSACLLALWHGLSLPMADSLIAATCLALEAACVFYDPHFA